MSLAKLGWSPEHARLFAELFGESGCEPARVTRTSKHCYHVTTAAGEFVARVSGGYRHRASEQADYPAVGEWVAVKQRPDTDEMNICGRLERHTSISRQAITGSGRGRRIEEQVLAANVDVAFLVAALDGERGFNLRRLERYLALAHKGGVRPVIVLNKADLSGEPEEELQRARSISGGAEVHSVSAVTGDGIAELEQYVTPGTTLVFLGPSGVGKSSIINCLFGEQRLAVGEVRESDGRGKHTTTWSELTVLPGGGLLIDTPGMREILLWSDEDSVAETFPEIGELARGCRFADCTHDAEPDCAVRKALDSGELDRERFGSFMQLREEVLSARLQLERSGAKRDGTRAIRVRREKRRRWKKP